jgi:OmpA family protein
MYGHDIAAHSVSVFSRSRHESHDGRLGRNQLCVEFSDSLRRISQSPARGSLIEEPSDYRLNVEGHTDDIGSAAYNDKLALQRANAVRDFLIKFGALPSQIVVTEKGKRQPEVDSALMEGRFMNRRVVLTVTDPAGKLVGPENSSDTKAAPREALGLRKSVSMLALADLYLRKTPPTGIFHTVGEKIGVVAKGDVVIARDEKIIRNLFGQYTWYSLDVLDTGTSKPKATGWVYAGSSNGPQYLRPIGATVVPAHPR